jgi:hypothetical protein
MLRATWRRPSLICKTACDTAGFLPVWDGIMDYLLCNMPRGE